MTLERFFNYFGKFFLFQSNISLIFQFGGNFLQGLYFFTAGGAHFWKLPKFLPLKGKDGATGHHPPTVMENWHPSNQVVLTMCNVLILAIEKILVSFHSLVSSKMKVLLENLLKFSWLALNWY